MNLFTQVPPGVLVHDRYRVVRLIGQGGMGAIYEAVDERLGHHVALKQMLVSGELFVRAFEREARVLAHLDHPALPNVSDYFADATGQFLVMDFVPGDDLTTMLNRQAKPFPLDQVMAWADQLLSVLDYLHTRQPPIVHRDIKPQNLKLAPRGEIKLLDFGLAKGFVDEGTLWDGGTSVPAFTPDYAPPEQIRGEGTNACSDLYALGATLYTLLTAAQPPSAQNRAAAALNGQPDPLRPAHSLNPQIPSEISRILDWAMALQITARPQSAAILQTALRDAYQGRSAPVSVPPVTSNLDQMPPRMHAWRRWMAILLVMILIVGAIFATKPPTNILGSGMSADEINAMFRDYGDAGGHWTGGGGTISVLLPKGRLAWLFSSTYLGAVNKDHSRPSDAPLVYNTMVVQEGGRLVDTLFGGSAQAPRALVTPTQSNEYFWVADGLVEANALKVLYNRYRRTGEGAFDFVPSGTSLATFALSDLTLQGVVDLPVGSTVSWGSALLVEDGYTYIYGASSASQAVKFAYLARATAGDLGGTWQFWTGTTWQTNSSAAAPLLGGVSSNFDVQKVVNQYILVTQDGSQNFNPQIVAYTAPTPTGPFSTPLHLFTAPESVPNKQVIVYGARLHPELARPGKLLLSYDVNSLDFADILADVRLYRPRFVEIDWPPPAPTPGRT